MSTQAFDTLMGIVWLALLVTFVAIHVGPRAVRYVRAWMYVRFFIRYEMTRCSLDAKVMERRH